jgi:hypothetical protein
MWLMRGVEVNKSQSDRNTMKQRMKKKMVQKSQKDAGIESKV